LTTHERSSISYIIVLLNIGAKIILSKLNKNKYKKNDFGPCALKL